MNREDIILMARESGIRSPDLYKLTVSHMSIETLERFAAIVAAATAKEYEERLRFTRERWQIECQSQVEIEREACAKIADRHHVPMCESCADAIADSIRARGQE
jgi:hypothetical protein